MMDLPKPSFVNEVLKVVKFDSFPVDRLPFIKVDIPPFLAEYTVKKDCLIIHIFNRPKEINDVIYGTGIFPLNFRSVLYSRSKECFGKEPQLDFTEELNSWSIKIPLDGVVPPSEELMKEAIVYILSSNY